MEDFKKRLEKIIGSEKPFSWAVRHGFNKASFSRIWHGESMPKADMLAEIKQKSGVSIDWLLTGEGPMRPGEVASAPLITASQLEERLKEDNDNAADIGELLKITHTVLNSKTIYRKALESNIIAFGRGVETEMEMEGMKQEMKEIRSLLQELVEAKRAAQAPEKKEQAA